MLAMNEFLVERATSTLSLSVCSVGAVNRRRLEHSRQGRWRQHGPQQYIDFTGVNATTFHDDDAVFTSVTQSPRQHDGHEQDEAANARLEAILRSTQSFDETESMRYTYWLTPKALSLKQ